MIHKFEERYAPPPRDGVVADVEVTDGGVVLQCLHQLITCRIVKIVLFDAKLPKTGTVKMKRSISKEEGRG